MIYLTYPDYRTCAAVLKTSHLEKQIKYIYGLISDNGCQPEDAILWHYHLPSLAAYWTFSIQELLKRPNMTLSIKGDIEPCLEEFKEYEVNTNVPDFIENHIYARHLMMSHRAHLLRENFKFYRKKFPKLARNLDRYPNCLFWMISNGDKKKDRDNNLWIRAMKQNQKGERK